MRTDVLGGAGTAPPNRLFWGDNLALMEALLPEYAGRIDLVYLDPPFNAGQEFGASIRLGEDTGVGAGKGAAATVTAYPDRWAGGAAGYLEMLYPRLERVRELLSPAGSLMVHVNWRVAHLVQVVLDELFGPGEREGAGRAGFRNEIVWGYGGGGCVRDSYRRKHDNLFWYTRSGRWTFNPQYREYSEKTRQRGLTAVKGDRYELREAGATLESWWTGPEVQKILSPTAAENLKFPTQKPETLLERIVRGHSNPGDMVADFFCGSGTTGAVAQQLERRWIMADQSPIAVRTAWKRAAALAGERNGPAVELWRTERQEDHSGGEVDAALVPVNGGFAVRLEAFRPVLPQSASAEIRERAAHCGLDFVDYWAVDWEAAGRTGGEMVHQWRHFRAPRARRLSLTSPARPVVGGSVVVKVVDVFGDETLCRLPVRGEASTATGRGVKA